MTPYEMGCFAGQLQLRVKQAGMQDPFSEDIAEQQARLTTLPIAQQIYMGRGGPYTRALFHESPEVKQFEAVARARGVPVTSQSLNPFGGGGPAFGIISNGAPGIISLPTADLTRSAVSPNTIRLHEWTHSQDPVLPEEREIREVSSHGSNVRYGDRRMDEEAPDFDSAEAALLDFMRESRHESEIPSTVTETVNHMAERGYTPREMGQLLGRSGAPYAQMLKHGPQLGHPAQLHTFEQNAFGYNSGSQPAPRPVTSLPGKMNEVSRWTRDLRNPTSNVGRGYAAWKSKFGIQTPSVQVPEFINYTNQVAKLQSPSPDVPSAPSIRSSSPAPAKFRGGAIMTR